MGKSSKQQKTNVSLFTTSATATATAGILFSGFDDSSNAAYFALVTHGIDRHRLRIFNVRSGAVSNDYSSENKEKFTSLTWGNIVDGTERAAVSIPFQSVLLLPARDSNTSAGFTGKWQTSIKRDFASGCSRYSHWINYLVLAGTWLRCEEACKCTHYTCHRLCC